MKLSIWFIAYQVGLGFTLGVASGLLFLFIIFKIIERYFDQKSAKDIEMPTHHNNF